MNQRRAKALRRKSYDLASVHLKSLLSDEEAAKVTPATTKVFEAEQESHIFDGESIRLAPYSSKWFYRRLKRIVKTGVVDFQLQSAKELGIDG